MNSKLKIVYVIGGIVAAFVLYKLTFSQSAKKDKEEVPAEIATVLEASEPASPSADEDYTVIATDGAGKEALIEKYTQMIQANPQDGNAYYQRAIIYEKDGRDSLAVQDYSRVITISPASANAVFNRGLVYAKQLDYKNAIEDFTQAIKLKADDPRIYNARGLAYVEMGDLSNAMADYTQAITIDPNFDPAYYNRGTVYERLQKFEEAREQYDQAIAVNEAQTEELDDKQKTEKLDRLITSYYRRAIMRLDTQDLEGALSDVNFVIENSPKDPRAYKLRAAIYTKSGNTAAAGLDEATAQNLGMEKILDKKDN